MLLIAEMDRPDVKFRSLSRLPDSAPKAYRVARRLVRIVTPATHQDVHP